MTSIPRKPVPFPDVTAVILAGGRGRRLGGADKGLMELAGHPLVEWAAAPLKSRVNRVLVSANCNRERYESLGFPVVADALPGYHGPLAGILSALRTCAIGHLLVVPCDCPLAPPDLVERLWRRLHESGSKACTAHDGHRLQPLFLLLDRAVGPSLENYLTGGGRKVEEWVMSLEPVLCDFSDHPLLGLNLNTPEDWARAEKYLDRTHAPC